ncbi:MAG: PQQ-binding-like beta-propeller repeat protein [Phycisphaerales bacterium]|nr:MAG: PQQ-binding-like beta-propeller repeat protein [Phycisphaerales bacterium]
MRKEKPLVVIGIATVAIVVLSVEAKDATAQWPQWGGPNRNFIVHAEGLADSWPADGPERLWSRELGSGYSTIAVDDGLLYTMYRRGDDEFVIALDAKTGETAWEHKQNAPMSEAMKEFEAGPNSTPLVVEDRLFTVGTNAVMHCFDKKSGKVLFKRDLADEFDFPVPDFGYSCSPIAYKNLVIVSMDRNRPGDRQGPQQQEATEGSVEGQSLIAFDRETGERAWSKHDYRMDYSSPVLVNFGGREQLVMLMQRGMIGVDPASGDRLWYYPVPQPYGENYATPVWTGDNLLLVTDGSRGCRLVELFEEDGRIIPRDRWTSRKLRIHLGNAVRVGDCIYGSSGGRAGAPAFQVALDIKTGKRLWIERGFAGATCLHADDKLIILDEEGHLALATATPEKLTVHAKCKITESRTWAAPTLTGKTLYVRDNNRIMALDLG